MADLTRDDIVGALKPAEDTVAEILGMGATKEEFAVLEHEQAGMPWTPNSLASWGSASTSTLTNRAWGSSSCTARSKIGAIARHGPHHAAQKSVTTGTSLRARCCQKRGPLSSTGFPGTTWHRNGRTSPVAPGESEGSG